MGTKITESIKAVLSAKDSNLLAFNHHRYSAPDSNLFGLVVSIGEGHGRKFKGDVGSIKAKFLRLIFSGQRL